MENFQISVKSIVITMLHSLQMEPHPESKLKTTIGFQVTEKDLPLTMPLQQFLPKILHGTNVMLPHLVGKKLWVVKVPTEFYSYLQEQL